MILHPYTVNPETTPLISIDFQVGFLDGSLAQVPDGAAALKNFLKAAEYWRNLNGTVYHVRNYFTPGQGPMGRIRDFAPDFEAAVKALSDGSPASALCPDLVRSGDIVVQKTAFSAVLGSNLLDQLRSRDVDTVIIGGLTTPICVQTTVDGLSMAGIKVIVLEDACASQPMGSLSARDAHEAAICRMGFLFAQVSSTAEFVEARLLSAEQRL